MLSFLAESTGTKPHDGWSKQPWGKKRGDRHLLAATSLRSLWWKASLRLVPHHLISIIWSWSLWAYLWLFSPSISSRVTTSVPVWWNAKTWIEREDWWQAWGYGFTSNGQQTKSWNLQQQGFARWWSWVIFFITPICPVERRQARAGCSMHLNSLALILQRDCFFYWLQWQSSYCRSPCRTGILVDPGEHSYPK